jgi:hypothetical protein
MFVTGRTLLELFSGPTRAGFLLNKLLAYIAATACAIREFA